MSAGRETPSWKEKPPGQNGKPQPHAALYACIYVSGVCGICGIFWNVLWLLFLILCFAYQNAGGPVRSIRPDHRGSIHMVSYGYSP